MSGSSSQSMSVSDLTFPELMSLLARRKWILIVNLILGAGIAFAISYFSPPEFTTLRAVQIDARTAISGGGSSDPVLSSVLNTSDDLDILTEIEVLQSSEIVLATYQKLNIPIPRTRAEAEASPRVRAEQITAGKVVQLSFTGRDEAVLKEFADELPDIYKNRLDELSRNRLSAAAAGVRSKVIAKEKDLRKAVADLAKLQRDKNIADARNEAEMRQTEANNAEFNLANARATERGAIANLVELQDQLKDIPKTRSDTLTEPNREQIELEKQTLNRYIQQREQLLVKFNPDHEKVIQLDRMIAKQEEYIKSIPVNVSKKVTQPNPAYDNHLLEIRRAQAAVQEANARVVEFAALKQQRDGERRAVSSIMKDQVKLEDRITNLRAELEQQRGALTALEIKNNQIDSPVTILERSGISEQTKPRWVINIILGALLGLLVGGMVAIARDVSLDQVNYPAEAVGIAGSDVLARIPIRARGRSPLIEDPGKARAFESYRLLRAGILMKLQQYGDGIFLVTSASRGEGKTVISGNLAVAMALEGRRTILVDANMRAPKIHKLFRVENEAGLADVLLDNASLEAAIVQTSTPGLSLITAGTELANPTEALASMEMLGLIEQLKARYDVVILDAPDAYGVADAQELTKHIRNVLFVVELQQSNKSKMEQSLSFLRQAGGRVLGLALNKDPMAKKRIS